MSPTLAGDAILRTGNSLRGLTEAEDGWHPPGRRAQPAPLPNPLDDIDDQFLSTTLAVCDKDHFNRNSDVPASFKGGEHRIRWPEEPWYSMVSELTCSKESAGIFPFGAVSSSGFGDGTYPYEVIYASDTDDRIIGFRVTYIGEDEEALEEGLEDTEDAEKAPEPAEASSD